MPLGSVWPRPISGTSARAPSPPSGRPEISSPAENALPNPVMTMTRTAWSICASVRISTRSRFKPCVMPLRRSGWLNVMSPMPGSCSATSKPRNFPVSIAGLLAAERRRSLLDEGAGRLAVVLRRAREPHIQRLLFEQRQQIARLGTVEVLLHARISERWATGDGRGEIHGLLLKVVVRDHFADHAYALCLIRLDDLAGEVEQSGALATDKALQEIRPAEVAAEAHVSKNRAKFGAIGGDADIAGERQAKARPDGVAVYHRDCRLRHRVKGVARPALRVT